MLTARHRPAPKHAVYTTLSVLYGCRANPGPHASHVPSPSQVPAQPTHDGDMPHDAMTSVAVAVGVADGVSVYDAVPLADGVAPNESEGVGVGGATRAHDESAHRRQ